MKISRGKVHDYLGMNLDFSVPGEVKITMIPYVKGMLADFSKYDSSDKTATTPAGVNLFKVDPNCALISEAMATAYHNMTAKALFLTKRCWKTAIIAPNGFPVSTWPESVKQQKVVQRDGKW